MSGLPLPSRRALLRVPRLCRKHSRRIRWLRVPLHTCGRSASSGSVCTEHEDGALNPIIPDLSKPHDEAIRELTAEYIARLEQVIRMAPDQYLWMHRRFRGIPVPEVPEK